MRELTFKGFLAQYIRHLSFQKTLNIQKLADEASFSNLRLREPLFLYALYSGKTSLLLGVTKKRSLRKEYAKMAADYTETTMTRLLEKEDVSLPYNYLKVWKSYLFQKNRWQNENRVKELMRQKVIKLQQQYGITNYRICKDLVINVSNLTAWLKYGQSNKVSLDVARRVVRYMESKSA